MNKLSKREKVMIYVMILVVIIGCGFLMLRPLLSSYQNAETDYEEAAFARESAEAAAVDNTELEKELEELQAYCNSNQAKLKAPVTNDEVEQKVADYVTGCNLLLRTTMITSEYLPEEATQTVLMDATAVANAEEETATEPTETEPTEPAASEDMTLVGEDGETLDDAINETTEQAEEAAEDETVAGTSYLTASLTLELVGTYGNFCRFLDKASTEDEIRVESYSVYSESGVVNYSLDGTETYSYYVDLSFFMQNVQ